MDPYTAAILGTAQAGFEFGAALCNLLASSNGTKIIEQAAKDRAKFEAWLQQIDDLFKNGAAAMQKAIQKGQQ